MWEFQGILVTCDVGTTQWTIKCEGGGGEGTIECDKSTITCDIGTTQYEDGTVKCEKKVNEPPNVEKNCHIWCWYCIMWG